jgi:hypothetical protein
VKKKGGRTTLAKKNVCVGRSITYRKPMPHLYTTRKRVRPKGSEEWGEWEVSCCGCGKKKP